MLPATYWHCLCGILPQLPVTGKYLWWACHEEIARLILGQPIGLENHIAGQLPSLLLLLCMLEHQDSPAPQPSARNAF